MAVTPARSGGTLHWRKLEMKQPHATTVPSLSSARLWRMPAATATASDRKSRAVHWPASTCGTAPTQPQPTTTPGTRGSVTCVVAAETSFVSTGSSLAAVSLAVLTSAASRSARATT